MEVRLHNCDCMAFMADIPDQYYDLAVVDPPYYPDARTIIVPGGDISTTGIRRRKYNMPHWETPTESYFHELFRVSKAQIIWGINYFPICPGSGRIVWDKCCDNGTKFSDCEIAYCSMIKRIRIFRFMWNGMLQGKSMTEYDIPQNSKRLKEARIHPTQKPVTLYKWIFREFVKEGDKVLDTHGGSMSSAIAAYDFGDGVFDLCEIDPVFFPPVNNASRLIQAKGNYFERRKMQETKDIPITKNGRVLTAEEARKEIQRINGAEEIPDPNVGRAPTTAEQIATKCEELKAMLMEKNRKYGDSALNPCRVFSRANAVEQILVRIDDKLNRIRNRQNDEDEDVVMDLAGYLILLMIARKGQNHD